MRSTTRAAAAVAAAVVLAAVLASTGSSAQGRAQLDEVKYATSFGTFGRDSFVYVAMEKGFFRDENLNVSVVPGLGTDNARLLAAGQIDYSGSEITGNMIGRIAGGFPVKIVAVTSQSTQAAIATLAEKGITTPKALEGKTLADLPASIVIRLFPLFAKRAGVDASKVNIVPGTPQTLPSLLATGRADAIGQFTVGKPTLVAAAGGRDVQMLRYSQYLKGLLGNGIVTTDERIRTKPDEVRRFTRAILKGLNYAVDNPGRGGPDHAEVRADRQCRRGDEGAEDPQVLREEQVHAAERGWVHRRPEDQVDGEHRPRCVQDRGRSITATSTRPRS